MIKKRLIIMVSLISLSIITVITAVIITLNKNANKLTPEYRLIAYENNIALFKNDELIKIFDEVVLNSLPKYDQESFKKGIIVSEINKIDEIIEDYE